MGGAGLATPSIFGVRGDRAGSVAQRRALVFGGAVRLEPRELDGERVGVDADCAPARENRFHYDGAAAAERIEHEPAGRAQPFDEAPGGEGVQSRRVAVEGMDVQARAFV